MVYATLQGQREDWALIFDGTWVDGDDDFQQIDSANALTVTYVRYAEKSCKNDDHGVLLGLLVHVADALECSAVNANADDDVDLRILRDTHLHQRAATWVACHPHDASLEPYLEIHVERATEKTWVKFCQSWSLQGWWGNSFP